MPSCGRATHSRQPIQRSGDIARGSAARRGTSGALALESGVGLAGEGDDMGKIELYTDLFTNDVVIV